MTPKEGLRLDVPARGILLVERVVGEAHYPEKPWLCSIHFRWVGQSQIFKVDGTEWNWLTRGAVHSRW